jgi:putative transposase
MDLTFSLQYWMLRLIAPICSFSADRSNFVAVVSNATSTAAAKFLRKVINEMPFKVKSIQVDGGSEFMADFEKECEKLKLPLYVLPPSRPQYNGGVERGNRIFREEFYGRNDINADSIGAFKIDLKKAVHKYNSYRPHFRLNGLTPFEYTNQILAA